MMLHRVSNPIFIAYMKVDFQAWFFLLLASYIKHGEVCVLNLYEPYHELFMVFIDANAKFI